MTHSPKYLEQRRVLKQQKRGAKQWAKHLKRRAHQIVVQRKKEARR